MIYAHFCERICLLQASVPSSPNHTPNGGPRLGATAACVLFNHRWDYPHFVSDLYFEGKCIS